MKYEPALASQSQSDGKKSSLFRTLLKSFNIKYEYNTVVIEAEQNIDTLGKITERFFSID